MSSQSLSLFPTIGAVAEKAAKRTTDHSEDQSPNTVQEEKTVEEVESLCMQCHQQGTTRLLLTSIPYFREVVVMSFHCEHCGWKNTEIQSAATIRPEGVVYTTKILSRSDLNRQIVRSPTCEIAIPELELTLPATGRGQLTTVEGLLRDIHGDLSTDQPLRRVQDSDGYEKVQALLDKIRHVLGNEDEEDEDNNGGEGTSTSTDRTMLIITVRLDDPAGNSFIEFVDNSADPKWNLRMYQRTFQQNVDLGLANPDETPQLTVKSEDTRRAESMGSTATKGEEAPNGNGGTTNESLPVTSEEIFMFPGACPSCGHQINTLMKKVNIPYFKDVLIMSTNCEHCGYRDNEVKSGSAISEKGKKITLKVGDQEDLSRDILKVIPVHHSCVDYPNLSKTTQSETAGLFIPEIDLMLSHGTLGGRFTTVEGILEQVYEELSDKVLSVFADKVSQVIEGGDSKTADERTRFEKFLSDLKAIKSASTPFTLVLDDPLANSHIQNLYAPDPDPNMTVEWYERTWEQNEELGLNDMKV